MRRVLVVLLLFLSLSAAHAQQFQDLIAKVDGAVGRVIAEKQRGLGFGSGFVISNTDDGALNFVTNNHVIDGGEEITVVFGLGDQLSTYDARVIERSGRYDLAVLKLVPQDAVGHRPEPLAVAIRDLAKAEHIAVLGYPGVSDNLLTSFDNPAFFDTTFASGSISKVFEANWDRGIGRFEMVQHTAPINQGNSGGPLIDLCGQLVGVNTAKPLATADGGAPAHGTFWASSSNTVARYLESADIPFATEVSDCGSIRLSGSFVGASGQVEGGSNFPVYVILLVLALCVLTAGGATVWARQRRASQAIPDGPGEVPSQPETAAKPAGRGLKIVVSDPTGQTQSHPVGGSQVRDGLVIGRGSKAGIALSGNKPSREHALLQLRDRRLTIMDLGSKNGTRVDGRKLDPHVEMQINSASRIEIGGHTISVQRPSA